jgi:hypothetical protein
VCIEVRSIWTLVFEQPCTLYKQHMRPNTIYPIFDTNHLIFTLFISSHGIEPAVFLSCYLGSFCRISPRKVITSLSHGLQCSCCRLFFSLKFFLIFFRWVFSIFPITNWVASHCWSLMLSFLAPLLTMTWLDPRQQHYILCTNPRAQQLNHRHTRSSSLVCHHPRLWSIAPPRTNLCDHAIINKIAAQVGNSHVSCY